MQYMCQIGKMPCAPAQTATTGPASNQSTTDSTALPSESGYDCNTAHVITFSISWWEVNQQACNWRGGAGPVILRLLVRPPTPHHSRPEAVSHKRRPHERSKKRVRMPLEFSFFLNAGLSSLASKMLTLVIHTGTFLGRTGQDRIPGLLSSTGRFFRPFGHHTLSTSMPL